MKDIINLKEELEDEARNIREDIFIKDSLCIKNGIWNVDEIFNGIKQRIKLDCIEDLIKRIEE